MFRYDRRKIKMRKISEERDQTLLGFESAECRYGFVVARDSSAEALYEARKLTEAFSDHLQRPSFFLYTASLKNTWMYFQNSHTLLSKVSFLWQQISPELAPRVVLSHHLLRGYLFATHEKSPGVFLADANHLLYRRFCAGLSWEHWLRGCLPFVGLLDLSKAQIKETLTKLQSFVKRVRDLRVDTPGNFPETLSFDDLERRFGKLTAQIWSHWARGEHPEDFPAFRSLKEDLYAPDFASFLEEVESFAYTQSFPLSEMQSLFVEIFFTCLKKVSALSVISEDLGIKDFRLEIFFDNKQSLTKDIELTFPIFARNKHTETILAHVSEAFPKRPHEVPCAHEPTFSLYVTCIEGMKVIPTRLTQYRCAQTGLFGENTTLQQSLAHLHEVIAVREKRRPQSFEVSFDLEPENAFVTRTHFHDNNETPLFRYASTKRPLLTMATPLKITLPPSPYPWVFLEAVGSWDYFQVRSALFPFALWVRSPSSERSLNGLGRSFFLVGIFEEHVN
jgi:hypothetical protein